jgi:hypothetical protein
MHKSFKWRQAEQGMVLMSSLTLLSILLIVGAGVAVMLQNDFRVVANLRGGTEAFYVSVAGLEWGKGEIARAASFPPAPSNQSILFSGGEFTVSFLPSTVIGPLAARVIVRSTGTSRGAQHLLQAQLTKSYDLSDAALAIRGNAGQVSFSANDIFISGADHDPGTGTAVPGAKSRNSVSVTDDTARSLVVEALGNPPRQGLLDESADMPATATSDYLPASFVTQLANDLCASPSASVHAIPNGGDLTMENQTWGNQAAPQLHCIEGLSGSADAVTLAGNLAGVGILVVKNADLILSGTFRWEGLVVVTGNDVCFKTAGTGSKALLGAALVNETGVPVTGTKIVDFEGAIRVLFSRQSLNRASQLIPGAAFNSAYGSLPSMISQDYWRAVTP